MCHQTEPNPSRHLAGIFFSLSLLSLSIFWIYLASKNWVYAFPDYARYVERAEAVRWSQPESMYYTLKPFGYPALIRSLFSVVGDYRLVGIGLSIFSGLICLICLDILLRRFGLGAWLRLIAIIVVGLERLFVKLAILPGTDMLHLAFLTLACVSFCKEKWSRGDAFLTGLIVGLGFLNRLRMPVFLLVPLARILLTCRGDRQKAVWSASLLIGFLLPASLQFTVNLQATGQLFAQKTMLLLFFLNEPGRHYWDEWPRWFGNEQANGVRLGFWLLKALPRNVSAWLGYVGFAFHAWALLFLPGVWSALRTSRGWSPLRCYLLVNLLFLLNLFLIPPGVRFGLFLLPPMVVSGIWFLSREVHPRLTVPDRYRSHTRAMTLALIAVLILWLAHWDRLTFGKMHPYATRNLQVEQTLQNLKVDPQESLLQVGVAFYQCSSPVPVTYPIHDGNPPGAELTLERLKEILIRRNRDYLLFAMSPGKWEFPHLWTLLAPLEDDPELELVELWPDDPRAALYRFTPAAKKTLEPVPAPQQEDNSRSRPTQPDSWERNKQE